MLYYFLGVPYSTLKRRKGNLNHTIASGKLNRDSLSWNAVIIVAISLKDVEYPIWLRSLRSSLRLGKPITRRREAGYSIAKS